MHPFVRNLITEWRRLKLPVADVAVVVGVSGGADSVSLLLALCELEQRKKHDLRLVAAHFNHELRGADSDADAEFVRSLTVQHGIEFATARAGNAVGEGNLEQSARDARYAFLTKTAEQVGAFAILTGHTVNDQAETFLLNLLRGSGPQGLGGMKAVRSFEFRVPSSESESTNPEPGTRNPELFSSTPLLVRPLLSWAKRLDTEAYCRDSGVEYRYDTMNEDTAFKRVRIRRILLPLLEDFNPNIVETLANTAALMQQIPDVVEHNDELAVSEIQRLEPQERLSRIRSWLTLHRGSTRQLALKHIQAVERLVLSRRSGRRVELPGGSVVKSGGRLVYERKRLEKSEADL